MKTLTITEAKKNLGKWLSAAVHGEEIGIISGATIIGLHPVEVQAVSLTKSIPIDEEYLRTEYGVTKQEMAAFEKAIDKKFARARRKLITKGNTQPKKNEEVVTTHRRVARTAPGTSKNGASRRHARIA